jgi:acyl carrier protein
MAIQSAAKLHRPTAHHEVPMAHAMLIADNYDAADPAIWSKVQEAFAEALGLDEDEVELNSRIIEELDAESLDFLDIAFRLERAFDIKIPRGGIESAAKEGVEDGQYEVDGVLTDVALAKLAEAMPELPSDELRPGLRTTQVPELFRVATFYNLVVRLLNEKEG